MRFNANMIQLHLSLTVLHITILVFKTTRIKGTGYQYQPSHHNTTDTKIRNKKADGWFFF